MQHSYTTKITLLLIIAILTISQADTATVDTRFYSSGIIAYEDVITPSTELLTPRYRGFDLYNIELDSSDKDSSDDTNDDSDYNSPEGFGIDILAEPLIWMSFGNFKDPMKITAGVTPRLRLYGWKGFMFDLRSYIAFADEIGSGAGYKGGTAVFSQVVKARDNHWFTGSFGWFTSERWGVDFQYNGAFLDNSIFLETQLGYTGHLAFEDSLFEFSKLGRFTSVVRLGYRVDKLNLLVQAECGKYIHDDFGGGGTLRREFGLISIALTGLYTENGANGGFAITVPLWNRRHPQRGRVRFGLADSYRFRYRFKQVEAPAHLYETGVDLSEKMILFHPGRVK